jgi:hypothetical protein
MLEWLYWGALGVSAAKAGIENSKCKQDVRTLPNGVRYYYDRRGITRLCSNDKPIYTNGNGLWTDTDYKVVYDGRDDRRKKHNKQYYDMAKENAENRGKRLRYIKQILPGHKENDTVCIDIEENCIITAAYEKEEVNFSQLGREGFNKRKIVLRCEDISGREKWYRWITWEELYATPIPAPKYDGVICEMLKRNMLNFKQ